jgi:uncharacterized membrane protein
MSDTHASTSSAVTPIADLTPADISDALRRGMADFRRAPLLGLVFAAFYIAIGLVLVWSTVSTGRTFYAIAITMGFPLIAPFAAVGFYETSRRLEQGEPLDWGAILNVVWAQHGRQLPWLGALAIVFFLFYLIVAHVIFAVILGPSALFNLGSSLDLLLTPRGLLMVAIELVVGAIFAFVVFSACVVSLPMLLDRDVDFVTAMVASIRAVGENPRTMAHWAVVVVVLLVLGMIPAFLGLFVVLPVLGHATWHLYRRTLPG